MGETVDIAAGGAACLAARRIPVRALLLGERLPGPAREISRTASAVLEIEQAKRTLRVERYIVLPIVVETALTLYEMGTGALGH
jgi:hypothetical protein